MFRCLGWLLACIPLNQPDYSDMLDDLCRLLDFHLSAQSGVQRLGAALVICYWIQHAQVISSHRVNLSYLYLPFYLGKSQPGLIILFFSGLSEDWKLDNSVCRHVCVCFINSFLFLTKGIERYECK